MKKCLRCTKQATLHITELKNGKSLSLHLCETCAQDYLSTVEVGGVPDEFTQPISMGNLPAPPSSHPPISNTKECPKCGITFKQFRSQGRLGCPHDYVEFYDDLLPLIESIHGETQHVGKIPPKAPDSSRRQLELIRLKNELKVAIDDEKYELAAQLRDQIKTQESEMEDETT